MPVRRALTKLREENTLRRKKEKSSQRQIKSNKSTNTKGIQKRRCYFFIRTCITINGLSLSVPGWDPPPPRYHQ